jgi:hypothetical protein
MKHTTTRELFRYWNDRRGTRAVPERGDIEPGAIRKVLGDTFILAFDRHNGHPFRVAGTRLCALFLRELKGQGFVDLWDAANRKHVRDLAAIVADEAVGLVAGASGRTADGAALDLELLLMPLSHRGSTHTRLLGALAPLAVPYWLGVTPIRALTLGPLRHLGPAVETIAAPRLASNPPPDETDGPSKPGRPQLVVYDGGRT